LLLIKFSINEALPGVKTNTWITVESAIELSQIEVTFFLSSEPNILSIFGVKVKFFMFRKKNIKDLFPSYWKTTHRKPIKAEPSSATNAEVIRELGSGRKRSRRIPIKGASRTTDVKEYFALVDSLPNAPEEVDSLQI
jgi:hypothetical protein